MSTRRTWSPVESKLVSEFCAIRYPDRRTIQRVRVGQIPTDLDVAGLDPSEIRMLGVWRRWVDAIVVDPPLLRVIEAAMLPDPGDISQLELYMHLIPMTPDLEEFMDLTPVGLLVYAIDDPMIHRLAADRGYGVEIYQPAWLKQYLDRVFPRERRAPLSQL